MNDDTIAIIGIGLRAPRATTAQQFWDNLVAARDCLSRPEGWTGSADSEQFVPVCGKLENVRGFDAEFFGYRPAEAELIDPQHRVFLECAWEALEGAGYAARDEDSVIGVYAATGFPTYLADHVMPARAPHRDADRIDVLLGNDKDFLAARAAYKLDLRGPAVTLQAACSSSLAAVHQAAQAILFGDCDMALAGGVAIDTRRPGGYFYEPGLILSPDGVVRSFDQGASGTVPSAGAGVVLLKRLEDAQRDGDVIYACLLGSSVCNDGARRAGFTAPTVDGVARAARHALAVAGVGADQVGYIEAHGSGTPLGDRTEIEALDAVYGTVQRPAPCLLGSVKSNIGHLDVAAGIAGFIKAVLCLHHRYIPQTLHCTQPVDQLASEHGPLRIADTGTPWAAPGHGQPRTAAVSSMGLGGHSVHAVLAEAPASAPVPATGDAVLLVWSGRDSQSGQELQQSLAAALAGQDDSALAGTAYSLAARRKARAVRGAAVAADASTAAHAVRAAALHPAPAQARRLIVQFAGFGELARVDRSVLGNVPALYAVVDEAVALSTQRFGAAFGSQLGAALAGGNTAGPSSLDVEHGAIYVWQVALARQFLSWGLQVDGWTGYSLGEFAAAAMAGVFDWRDGLALVVARARCIAHAAPAGQMLAVSAPWEEVQSLVGPGMHLAIDAGVQMCVLGGAPESAGQCASTLLEQGIAVRVLGGAHPLHTPLMAAAAQGFGAALRELAMAPSTSFHSGLLGSLQAAEAATPAYWQRHLTESIRYRPLLAALDAHGPVHLVEMGQGRDLSAACRLTLGQRGGLARHSVDACALAERGKAPLLAALGEWWTHGASIDWTQHFGAQRQKVALPTYPFQRSEFWIEAVPRIQPEAASLSAAYRIAWRPLAAAPCVPGSLHDFVLDLAADTLLAGHDVAALSDDAGIAELIDKAMQAPSAGAVLTVRATTLAWTDRDPVNKAALVLGKLGLACERSAAGTGRRVRLVVMAECGFVVLRGDAPLPLAHVLASCATVIGQELHGVDCMLVETGGAPAQHDWLGELPAAGCVARRAGQWWERSVEASAPPVHLPGLLRAGACYLISGGTGGIGRVLAHYLAATYGATVILLSRTAAPHAAPANNGGSVISLAADVTVEASVRAALAQAGLPLEGVHGVFHLAGLSGHGTLLADVTIAELEEMADAKCAGLLTLGQLFAPFAPDFLAAFSSSATLLGGTGLYAYCAANAYVDGAVEVLSGHGSNWMSLGWDGWDVSDAGNVSQFNLQQYFFDSKAALALLDQLLVRGQSGHVLCMNGDIGQRRRAPQPRRATPTAAASGADADEGASEAERAVAQLWSAAMGVQVGVDSDFFKLGGDSLLAVRIAGIMRKQFGLRIPLPAFIKHSTPRKLAALMDSLQRSVQDDAGLVPGTPHAASATAADLNVLSPLLNTLALVAMERSRRAVRAAGVVARHRRLYDYIVELGDEHHALRKADAAALESQWRAAVAAASAAAGHPAYQVLVRGLAALGQALAPILSGEEDALSMVFDGGDSSFAQVAYRDLPEAVAVLDTMAAKAAHWLAARGDKPLRVLELGGGLGVATDRMAALLPAGTDYVFTDVSAVFFREIQARFPHLQCQLLDLNELGAVHDVLSGAPFDLIIAANALHCAKSVSKSLAGLATLAAPQAGLLLVEGVRNEPWHLLAMGALSGFLDCSDFRIAQAGPFIALPKWRSLLNEGQWQLPLNEDDGTDAARLGQVALLAQRAGGSHG